MNTAVEFLTFMAVFFVVSFLVSLPIVFSVRSFDKYDCDLYGEQTGLETNYAMMTCYVNDEDYGWLTKEERRLTRFGQRIYGESN